MDSSAAFWIFVAAVAVGGMWADTRLKAEKHETLRRIVEKTGTIDEVRLRELFGDGAAETKPGYAYRGLRITGTITLFLAAAIALAFVVATGFGKTFGPPQFMSNVTPLIFGLSVSAGVAVIGLGLFFSARFATPPLEAGSQPPAR